MAVIIWIDENGKEKKRETKGRGRPPKGSEKRDDGNFYVKDVDVDIDNSIYYVVTDENGEVIRKEIKGRGRPKPGFQKAADGHWYMLERTSPVEAK